jgi:hypothetical protein
LCSDDLDTSTPKNWNGRIGGSFETSSYTIRKKKKINKK